MIRYNETLHTSYKTRIGRFKRLKSHGPAPSLQRRAKLFHKMTLFQKAQIICGYFFLSGFIFFKIFVSVSDFTISGRTKLQGGPRERKAASRQKTAKPRSFRLRGLEPEQTQHFPIPLHSRRCHGSGTGRRD